MLRLTRLFKIANIFSPLVQDSAKPKTDPSAYVDAATIWDKLFPNHNPRGYIRDESDDM